MIQQPGAALLSLSSRYKPSITLFKARNDTWSVAFEESIDGISWASVRFNTCLAANFPPSFSPLLVLCLPSLYLLIQSKLLMPYSLLKLVLRPLSIFHLFLFIFVPSPIICTILTFRISLLTFVIRKFLLINILLFLKFCKVFL